MCRSPPGRLNEKAPAWTMNWPGLSTSTAEDRRAISVGTRGPSPLDECRAAVGTELLAGRVLGPARSAAHGQGRAAVAAELLPLQVGRAAVRALHAAPITWDRLSLSQLAP